MRTSTRPVQPLAAIGVALLAVPLVGIVATAPWAAVPGALADGDVLGAVVVSLGTATLATGLVAVVGIPLGWVLARDRRWRWVRPICLVPLVLPPVVAGVALQRTWGPGGLIGGGLAALGISPPVGTTAVVLAQAFVALPFCVLAVETAVRRIDPRAEEVAEVCGLTGAVLLRRVLLPLAGPGILAGVLLAFARAVGEQGATAAFALTVPGRTETMPLAVARLLQTDPPAAVALSLVQIVIAIGVLAALGGRLGITTVGVDDPAGDDLTWRGRVGGGGGRGEDGGVDVGPVEGDLAPVRDGRP